MLKLGCVRALLVHKRRVVLDNALSNKRVELFDLLAS